jgi:hypothetical protein
VIKVAAYSAAIFFTFRTRGHGVAIECSYWTQK